MTATYDAVITSVPLSPAKKVLGIWNGHATNVVKIRRAWVVNGNSYTMPANAFITAELRRATDYELLSGTPVPISKRDSTNAAVNAAIEVVTGGAWTLSGAYRIINLFIGALAVSSTGPSAWASLTKNTVLWDRGCGDTNIKKLTLRQNEGVAIMVMTNMYYGSLDAYIEFTVE